MVEINGLRVLVDFIVNAQGRVESPLILESSGETNEKQVLGVIQQWRFRPAICNGVPTNVELRVLFEGPRKRLPHPVACVGQSASADSCHQRPTLALTAASSRNNWGATRKVMWLLLRGQHDRNPVTTRHEKRLHANHLVAVSYGSFLGRRLRV